MRSGSCAKTRSFRDVTSIRDGVRLRLVTQISSSKFIFAFQNRIDRQKMIFLRGCPYRRQQGRDDEFIRLQLVLLLPLIMAQRGRAEFELNTRLTST